ncbi:MAG: DotU family type IV/VI secretion system protein [Geobacteraceae bacterium]|nr:DotU family type IV/VI secretion system protein [Geobacteraceae bacterium]
MHLTDCFMELIAYVVYFRKNVASRQPAFEQVKADIHRLLSGSDGLAARGGFPREDYEQAHFAVCAWVDETILDSPWESRTLWQREQLQRVYYNTTEAGEEFFERLNRLGLHQRDVREVYYLCLALGFRGRFIHPGDEFLLEQLKASNLKLLVGGPMGIPSLEKADLFPGALPLEAPAIIPQPRRFRFSMLAVGAVIGPVALFCLLYLIYWVFLNSISEKILRAGA